MLRLVSGFYLLIVTLLAFTPIEAREIPSEDQQITYNPKPHPHEKKDRKKFSHPFIKVAKECTPAVAFIQAEGGMEPGYDPRDFFNEDFFNRFFGHPPSRRQRQARMSQGSGFVISPDGYIMTNFHVVKGAKKITVHLQGASNRELEATLIGGDSYTDIAVIKLNDKYGKDFPFLEFGDSEALEVGEWVVAIGNPFQLEASVTAGVISAKGRQDLQITDYECFLQTDAAINPGNSGGPLIDLEGKVIGMNTAIVSQSGGYMGIGFAIPSRILQNIQQQLVHSGNISRGFLGVSLQPITSDLAEAFKLKSTHGALVAEVLEGSPAEKAGLKQGDIITKLNGHPVKNPNTLRNDVHLLAPETKIMLTVYRQGKILSIPVILGVHGKNPHTSSETPVPSLGFSIDNLTPENITEHRLNAENPEGGVVITQIEPGSIAHQAGLKKGSLIVAVNHQKVTNVNEFEKALKNGNKEEPTLLLIQEKHGPKFYSFRLD